MVGAAHVRDGQPGREIVVDDAVIGHAVETLSPWETTPAARKGHRSGHPEVLGHLIDAYRTRACASATILLALLIRPPASRRPGARPWRPNQQRHDDLSISVKAPCRGAKRVRYSWRGSRRNRQGRWRDSCETRQRGHSGPGILDVSRDHGPPPPIPNMPSSVRTRTSTRL